MSRDNRLWGTERIRGGLLKLGIAVSSRSIRRYRRHGADRPPSQWWRTFLANHRPSIWAADLLTIQTLTVRTLYVLIFVAHGRRELVAACCRCRGITRGGPARRRAAVTRYGRTACRLRRSVHSGNLALRRPAAESVAVPAGRPLPWL
jgi:hypothetical protein